MNVLSIKRLLFPLTCVGEKEAFSTSKRGIAK